MISLDISSIVGDGICNTEVNKLQLAPHKNEVCGLQIRMDDFLLVDNVNSLQHLFAYISNRMKKVVP